MPSSSGTTGTLWGDVVAGNVVVRVDGTWEFTMYIGPV